MMQKLLRVAGAMLNNSLAHKGFFGVERFWTWYNAYLVALHGLSLKAI